MKKKTQKPITKEITPNKASAVVTAPQTLTEHYAHWYKTLFNKYPKEEQDALLANLAKGQLLIRGESREFSNVRAFTRAVIEKAEFEYDKLQAKLQAEAEKAKLNK